MDEAYIELVVDGDIVELNRIRRPADTVIIDQRFDGGHAKWCTVRPRPFVRLFVKRPRLAPSLLAAASETLRRASSPAKRNRDLIS
jgi:hypothetical protein